MSVSLQVLEEELCVKYNIDVSSTVPLVGAQIYR